MTIYTVPVAKKHSSIDGIFWYFKAIKSNRELCPSEHYCQTEESAKAMIEKMKAGEGKYCPKRRKRESI